ncbi:hypothetical protein [Streptomyces cavernae]|uniref:hypothetical protein n=1 Tax=Streptomyces cavernae TaxID=2259034 RepID=UPI000FEB5DB0|nr:hypothetical protein [Streptomyces cavernae]
MTPLGDANHGGPGSSGEPADGPLSGLGPDELALRRMLHQAVQELEPSDRTLEHLRRAVPARRARKRQASVGMAAAALLIGTAIPALVHVSNATDSDTNPSIAANSEQTKGSDPQGKDPSGGSAGGDTSTDKTDDSGKADRRNEPSEPEKGADGGGTGGPEVTASAATERACEAVDLGGAAATAGTPDSAGAVYGSFTVSNVSTSACTVFGSGTVSFTPQGAADSSKITVSSHTAGDKATGLPDPSLNATGLVLQPGTSYEVKFAWVPSETCPTTSGGGSGGTDPSTGPSPTDGTTDSSGAGETDGVAAQLVTADGVADGSVTVSYTAEVESPSTGTTISNACAGTIYRTGLLAAGS